MVHAIIKDKERWVLYRDTSMLASLFQLPARSYQQKCESNHSAAAFRFTEQGAETNVFIDSEPYRYDHHERAITTLFKRLYQNIGN